MSAEATCIEKVDREMIKYIADYVSSAAIARGVDFAVAILTMRVQPQVAAAFGADGLIGAALNAKAAAKIMEGAHKAKMENCSCDQYEK